MIKVSNSGKELIMKAMKRGNLQYRGDLYTTLMKALYTEGRFFSHTAEVSHAKQS